jgi:uncharacterized protein YhaN
MMVMPDNGSALREARVAGRADAEVDYQHRVEALQAQVSALQSAMGIAQRERLHAETALTEQRLATQSMQQRGKESDDALRNARERYVYVY